MVLRYHRTIGGDAPRHSCRRLTRWLLSISQSTLSSPMKIRNTPSAIYGFEEANDIAALIMEMVDGRRWQIG